MKHTYGMTTAALAIATATALVSSASAASLQFDLIHSRFFDPVGGNVLSTTPLLGAFGDPSTIRWGQDALATNLDAASGYQFVAATPLPFTALPDEVFGLGDFTHFNNVINSGTAITGVNFEVKGQISVVDGMMTTLIGERTFSFFIDHDETPNTASACPGDTPPCDDEVAISTSIGTDTFEFEGSTFTLSILGFAASLADAELGVFNADFFSEEGGDNTRVLAAAFTQDVPSSIPLPAAGWLLLAGIGGLGALRRFRKT